MNALYIKLTTNKRIKPLVDVGIFSLLIISFHFLYIWWGNSGFWPIQEQVNQFYRWGSRVLFEQSDWVISKMGIDYYKEGQTFYITARDGSVGWLEVAPGCTALKQWGHWFFLMLNFPGSWKHKAWYIPLGLLVIQFVSVFRIVGLLVSLTFRPDQFDFFHDYILKTLFYASIFLMWVVWVQVFRKSNHFYTNNHTFF